MNFKDSYSKNGYCYCKEIFPMQLASSAAREVENSFDALADSDGSIVDIINGERHLRYVPRPHHSLPIFYKFVISKTLSMASELLEEEVYLIGMDLHFRVPNSLIPTPPHHDSFYGALKKGMNLWLLVILV